MRRETPILIILLLVLAMLVSCSNENASKKMPADNAYHPNTDYPYSMRTENTATRFAETEKGFYFHVPSTLFYMDTDGMEPMPVCDKPNCLHYAEPDVETFQKCNAYFDSGRNAYTSLYDGDVFLIHQGIRQMAGKKWLESVWEVLRVSPDGSQRKTVWTLGNNIALEGMLIHRGVMYISMRTHMEDGGTRCGIWTLDLQMAGAQPRCILETEQQGRIGMTQSLTAYGNNLYFVRVISEDLDRELCILNTQTGTLKTVQPIDGYSPRFTAFQNGKMLLECRMSALQTEDPTDPGAYPERLYRCDLDGSDPVLIVEELGQFFADEQYIYRIPTFFTNELPEPCIHIYDKDMHEVDHVDLSVVADREDFSLVCAGSAQNGQVLVEMRVRVNGKLNFVYYWFDKAEIGTGNIVLHFILNEADGYTDVVMSGGSTDAAPATTKATTTSAAETAVTPSMGPVTTAPVRTPAAHWDTGSITVDPLGLDLEDKAVEFMCSVPQESLDELLPAWEKAARYMSETYMGEVTLTPLPYVEYLQTLRKRQAAGDAPDVFPVENVSGNKLSDLARKGQVIPLDAYVDACMPRSFARVDERLYEMVRFDGRIYGILSLSEDLFPRQTLYFDKSMTDAAGIEIGDWMRMSDNWETFYQMREWLDTNRPDLHDTPVAAVEIGWAEEGLFEMIGGSESCAGVMLSGYEVTDGTAEAEVLNIYDSEAFCEYLLNLRQMKLDRILPEDWTFWPGDEQKETYYHAEGCAFRSEYAEAGDNWAKSVQSRAFCTSESIAGAALVVSADSDLPDAACKLIELLNCDKYAGTLLHLGEEGVHWAPNAAGQAEIRVDLGLWNNAALCDVTNCIVPASEAADFRENLEAAMANAVCSANLGFRLDVRQSSGDNDPLLPIISEFKTNVLCDYLGMGTGKMLYTASSIDPIPQGYDVRVGKLMDCSLTQEELEKGYRGFAVRMYDASYGLAGDIRDECQRQLDAWRAGR